MSLTTQHNLRFYYDKAFPFATYDQWLSYSESGNEETFSRREFSFTLKKGEREYYLRWKTLSSGWALRDAVLKLDPAPEKLDIGAIYNRPCREREMLGAANHHPVEREVVIDIDMNDYDEIRTCCKDKTVCDKCWKFLHVAMMIITAALKEDFGFRHIMWVFSGRRGVHCWVLDKCARQLSSEGRTALAEYLNYVTNGNEARKVRLLHGHSISPFVMRSTNLASPIFRRLLDEQEFMARGTPLVTWVDAYMASVTKKVEERYVDLKAKSWNDGSSRMLWKIVETCCSEARDKVTPLEIMFAFCYPRLDIQVTRDLGHLLKAPFCVHPATGKVCVPIPPSQWKTFSPDLVPTLLQLRKDFDEGLSLENSCMGASLRYFKEFITSAISNQSCDIPEGLCLTALEVSDEEEGETGAMKDENVATIKLERGKSLAYEISPPLS